MCIFPGMCVEVSIFESVRSSACICLVYVWADMLRKHCAARLGVLLPASQGVVRMKGGDLGREGRMEVQGKRRSREAGGREGEEGEGQSPAIRCCQDNSRQQYLLQRTKQKYLREQKSANTCWEKEGKKGGRHGAVH